MRLQTQHWTEEASVARHHEAVTRADEGVDTPFESYLVERFD